MSVFMPRALGLVFPGPEMEEDSLTHQPPLGSKTSIWASSGKGTTPEPPRGGLPSIGGRAGVD